jgi:hypothetical protein
MELYLGTIPLIRSTLLKSVSRKDYVCEGDYNDLEYEDGMENWRTSTDIYLWDSKGKVWGAEEKGFMIPESYLSVRLINSENTPNFSHYLLKSLPVPIFGKFPDGILGISPGHPIGGVLHSDKLIKDLTSCLARLDIGWLDHKTSEGRRIYEAASKDINQVITKSIAVKVDGLGLAL